MIKQILTCFATDYPFQKPKPSVEPKKMHLLKIYNSQKAIGWLNFHKGLISIEFGKLQDLYYKKIKAPKTLNETRWSKTLLHELMTYSRSIWNHRCDIVAIRDEQTLEKRIRKEAKAKYDRLKQKFWTLRTQDRELVSRDEDFFEKSPFQMVVFWMNQINIAQENAAYQATKDTQDLRNFFKPRKSSSTKYHSGIPQVAIIPQQVLNKKSNLRVSKRRKRTQICTNDVQKSKIDKWIESNSVRKKQNSVQGNVGIDNSISNT